MRIDSIIVSMSRSKRMNRQDRFEYESNKNDESIVE